MDVANLAGVGGPSGCAGLCVAYLGKCLRLWLPGRGAPGHILYVARQMEPAFLQMPGYLGFLVTAWSPVE